MVEIDRHRDVRVLFDHDVDDGLEVAVLGVFSGASGDLEDQRGPLLGDRLHDPLRDFHVVDVERANGIAILIGHFKHLLGVHQRHSLLLTKSLNSQGHQDSAPGYPAGGR